MAHSKVHCHVSNGKRSRQHLCATMIFRLMMTGIDQNTRCVISLFGSCFHKFIIVFCGFVSIPAHQFTESLDLSALSETNFRHWIAFFLPPHSIFSSWFVYHVRSEILHPMIYNGIGWEKKITAWDSFEVNQPTSNTRSWLKTASF